MSENHNKLNNNGEYRPRRQTQQSNSSSERSNASPRANSVNNPSVKTNPPSRGNRSEHAKAVGRYTQSETQASRTVNASSAQTQRRNTANQSQGFKVKINDDEFYDTETTRAEISTARRMAANTAGRKDDKAVAGKNRAVKPQTSAQHTTAAPTQARRVVTTSLGDRYQIHEENAIAPKQIKSKQRSVRKKNRGCIVAVVYAAVVCSISLLLSYYLIVGINDMFGLVKDKTEIVIEVPKGATLNDITDLLDDNDVVDFPVFFKLYAKVTHTDTGFKAGTFTLNSKSDYDQILTKLRKPAGADKSTIMVTIPEGLTVEQVAQIMEDNSVCDASAFLESINNKEFTQKFIKNVDTGNKNRPYKLEGFLYPETYNFYLSDGSVNAINKLLNQFNVIWTDEMVEQAKKINMSMDDVVTLASIIEREASKSEDRYMIASVFCNRLTNTSVTGGKLQSDATRWYPYASYEELMASDKLSAADKKDWVDNHKGVSDTYRVKGLPDSPICSPSLDSIKAVLYHDKTQYYFFCSDDKGNFYYAKTLKEHNANFKKAGLA